MALIRSILFNVCYLIWSAVMHIVCMPLLLAPASWVWKAAHLWIDGTLLPAAPVLRARPPRDSGSSICRTARPSSRPSTSRRGRRCSSSRRLNHPAFILKRELLLDPAVRLVHPQGRHDRGRPRRQGRRRSRRWCATPTRLRRGPPDHHLPRGHPRRRRASTSPTSPASPRSMASSTCRCVPVALNSGLFWGKKAWVKKPGRIPIQYLPPIPPGLDRKAFMAELEARLEPAAKKLLTGSR